MAMADIRRATLVLVAVGLAAAIGCGRKGPPPADTSKIIGTWTESTDASAAPQSPRFAPPPQKRTKNLRQFTFQQDKTFQMILCSPDGKPLDAAKSVQGTWAASGPNIELKVTGSTLDKKDADLAPEDGGVLMLSGDVLRIPQSSGELVDYKKSG
jgi:hypothetical protein